MDDAAGWGRIYNWTDYKGVANFRILGGNTVLHIFG